MSNYFAPIGSSGSLFSFLIKLIVSRESCLMDVVRGIKDYFNVMLGFQLLYKFERTQYSEVSQFFLFLFCQFLAYFTDLPFFTNFDCNMFLQLLAQHPDKPMSGIYGGIHLLRLFGKIAPLTIKKEKRLAFYLSLQVYTVCIFFFCPFLVKLGKNLAYTPLDDKSIKLLLMQIQDFLRSGHHILFSILIYPFLFFFKLLKQIYV